MRQIATDAGVTKTMVYYYFGSKEGLYRALLDEVYLAVRARLRAAMTVGDTPRQRLVSLAKLHLDFIRDNADTSNLMLRACMPAAGDDAPAVDVERFRSLHIEAMRDILSTDAPTGALPDALPDADLELLAAVFHGAMGALRHDTVCGNDTPADLPEKIVELLWGGFAARIDP